MIVQLAEKPAADFNWSIWFLDKVAGSLLAGLVIAALGSWLIAQINERYRGRREHMSKAVDALRAQVEAVVKLAGEYWCSDYDAAKSPSQASELQYKLDDIDALTRICAAQLWQEQSDSGPQLVSALFSAVVTADFGTTTKGPMLGQLQYIVRAGAALTSAVALSRHEYLASGLPQRIAHRVKRRWSMTWASIYDWADRLSA